MNSESPQPAPDADPFEWPSFGLEDDVRPLLRRARAAGRPMALATIAAVEGGAPRGLGAQMAFCGGTMSGFLSGGCVEADVALHAEAALASGEARRLVYGEGGPSDIRLPCGSRLEILLEALAPEDPALARLLSLEEQRSEALWLSDGRTRACLAPGEASPSLRLGPAQRLALRSEAAGGEVGAAIFRRWRPRTRVLILGSEPIALALIELSRAMRLEVALIRPKGPSRPPTPVAAYFRGEAAEAVAALRPDRFTAIAVITHEGDLEEEALLAALTSKAGYVGVLGSRRRIAARRRRLSLKGLAEAELDRLHAPIGLPIGGKAPFDIALSVLAEIVETMSSPQSQAGALKVSRPAVEARRKRSLQLGP